MIDHVKEARVQIIPASFPSLHSFAQGPMIVKNNSPKYNSGYYLWSTFDVPGTGYGALCTQSQVFITTLCILLGFAREELLLKVAQPLLS